MGSLFLNEIKKQASNFLQEQYKTARLTLTDVTQAELLAEEATNPDPWGPDARTMTRLAEASFDMDDYWRIADVLHRRFYSIDWKEWRQAYKSLVLLEFLLTHGHEYFAEEFCGTAKVIQELGTFHYIDQKGFNWGDSMQKKSKKILELLEGGEKLEEARSKALRVTKEIEGFGNLLVSPPSSSSSSPSSSRTIGRSSFGSFSSSSSVCNEMDELKYKDEGKVSPTKESPTGKHSHDVKHASAFYTIHEDNSDDSHFWSNSHVQDSDSLHEHEHEGSDDVDECNEETSRLVNGGRYKLLGGDRSKNGGEPVLRSLSDVGKVVKKKFKRQFSLGY